MVFLGRGGERGGGVEIYVTNYVACFDAFPKRKFLKFKICLISVVLG